MIPSDLEHGKCYILGSTAYKEVPQQELLVLVRPSDPILGRVPVDFLCCRDKPSDPWCKPPSVFSYLEVLPEKCHVIREVGDTELAAFVLMYDLKVTQV